MIDKRIFTPQEARQQIIADGLTTVSFPETVPDDADFPEEQNVTPERPGMTGKPIAPSQGGYGEVKSRSDVFDLALEEDDDFKNAFEEIDEIFPELSEDDQEDVYQELQNYLDNFSRSANSLDTKIEIHDNIMEGV